LSSVEGKKERKKERFVIDSWKEDGKRTKRRKEKISRGCLEDTTRYWVGNFVKRVA
jgi:hypothetical protein